ncbi:phosphatase domain-containing protein [Cellulomonas rhizosphaerae]|uniref:Adenylyl-sulfate kinase n=1 Tax=Cellulomonas rhizosphaerae TaxID=2293719 RepID=A0A413RJJ1_9CELL|nr:AAA family ATPase [Cellulomonas rhizosphaerae]RHA38698.1 adenylyl-sulfate kinase [Cellulomonas rhizosphaerae]
MTLIITRGYPGSGKTTYAQAWVAEDPEQRARVNRDDLRGNLYCQHQGLTFAQEQTITAAQHAAVRALLTAGRDVIVDDTNLRLRHARNWADLAVEKDVPFVVIDVDTPVDECIRRDANRARVVGERVIRDMAARFRFPLPPVLPSERTAETPPAAYEANLSLPPAWMVDVDGTLANMGERSPHDITRVLEDTCHTVIADLVGLLGATGASIVVMSGRDEGCRADTETWLEHNLGDYAALHMRPAGDGRADYIVKAELFDQHVRDRWNVVGVLDDRDQVVRMWRAMGLTCLQVAEGNF